MSINDGIVNINLSKIIEYAQSHYQTGDLVLVITDDPNKNNYGRVSTTNSIYRSLRMREDWREKLQKNSNGRLENMIVDFGGYGDKWSKMYHATEIVNVRLLGQYIASNYLESQE